MSTFIITMQKKKGIPDLKKPQVQHTLEFLFSALIPIKEINIEADLDTPVNIITQEKILNFCWTSSNFKQFHQVVLAEWLAKCPNWWELLKHTDIVHQKKSTLDILDEWDNHTPVTWHCHTHSTSSHSYSIVLSTTHTHLSPLTLTFSYHTHTQSFTLIVGYTQDIDRTAPKRRSMTHDLRKHVMHHTSLFLHHPCR